jgi:hypothetical protein
LGEGAKCGGDKRAGAAVNAIYSLVITSFLIKSVFKNSVIKISYALAIRLPIIIEIFAPFAMVHQIPHMVAMVFGQEWFLLPLFF